MNEPCLSGGDPQSVEGFLTSRVGAESRGAYHVHWRAVKVQKMQVVVIPKGNILVIRGGKGANANGGSIPALQNRTRRQREATIATGDKQSESLRVRSNAENGNQLRLGLGLRRWKQRSPVSTTKKEQFMMSS